MSIISDIKTELRKIGFNIVFREAGNYARSQGYDMEADFCDANGVRLPRVFDEETLEYWTPLFDWAERESLPYPYADPHDDPRLLTKLQSEMKVLLPNMDRPTAKLYYRGALDVRRVAAYTNYAEQYAADELRWRINEPTYFSEQPCRYPESERTLEQLLSEINNGQTRVLVSSGGSPELAQTRVFAEFGLVASRSRQSDGTLTHTASLQSNKLGIVVRFSGDEAQCLFDALTGKPNNQNNDV